MFFPVPVDGKLARDMATMIKEFNDKHPDIKAMPVYTGTYDETLIKTRAAIKAGKPPAAVIMSANFLTDLKIEGEIAPLDDLIKASGKTSEKFMSQFFPALHGNAVLDYKVYGVPFHNSTPLLYYNVDHFKEAGPRSRQAAADLGRAGRGRQEARRSATAIASPAGAS